MMLLVQFIDVIVEIVKWLVGAPGHRNVFVRIIAWLFVLAILGAIIGLIAWGVSLIPQFIDILNGD